MKIYTITVIQSNVCEVKTEAFIDYDKAINKWNELLAEHKAYYKEALDEEETDEGEESRLDSEEYTRDSEHKHFSYDDGEFFNALDFDTHEVD